MNRVRLFTCLALVLVVVAFVAVWMTIPSGHRRVKASTVSYPARLFRYGAQTKHYVCCPRATGVQFVDPQKMKNHAIVFFGGLAAVVLLLGVAFGAASRRNVPPSTTEAVSSD
jgi:hypothetical protein